MNSPAPVIPTDALSHIAHDSQRCSRYLPAASPLIVGRSQLQPFEPYPTRRAGEGRHLCFDRRPRAPDTHPSASTSPFLAFDDSQFIRHNAFPALSLRARWVRLADTLFRGLPLLPIWTLDVLTFGLFTIPCFLLPAPHTTTAHPPPTCITWRPIYQKAAA